MPTLPSGLESSGTAWISSDVIETLLKEVTLRFPNETGGVLLGYWSESPLAPVITKAVGPGPNAQHSEKRFFPDHRFHELEVARLWESDRHLHYLGDWHSHPGAPGTLSDLDISTLRFISASRQARAPRPLMLILGDGPNWTPNIWSLRKRRSCYLFNTYRVEKWDVEVF